MTQLRMALDDNVLTMAVIITVDLIVLGKWDGRKCLFHKYSGRSERTK